MTLRFSRLDYRRTRDASAALGMTFRYGGLDYTASDKLVKVKSRILSGGTRLPLSRTGLPSASKLFSMMTGLSLKRKFFTGNLMAPFSM